MGGRLLKNFLIFQKLFQIHWFVLISLSFVNENWFITELSDSGQQALIITHPEDSGSLPESNGIMLGGFERKEVRTYHFRWETPSPKGEKQPHPWP